MLLFMQTGWSLVEACKGRLLLSLICKAPLSDFDSDSDSTTHRLELRDTLFKEPFVD